jgi:hypothetical protein
MANPSSRKKIARAARAGGTRRVGERRPLGFNAVLAVIVLLGVLLVVVARHDRVAQAHPLPGGELNGGDHWHDGYSIYTCVPDPAPAAAATPGASESPSPSPDAGSSAPPDAGSTAPDASGAPTTTLAATTTTINPASTTIPAPGEVPGYFHDPLTDVGSDLLGIHTHGDSLIHIHPFTAAQVSGAGGTGSAFGRKARLGVFMDDTGVVIDNSQIVLPDGQSFVEGQTKCSGKEGEVQVARWDTIQNALDDHLPNALFTSDFRNIRLSRNGEYFVIAFVPHGAHIPVNKPVLQNFQQNGASDVSTTTVPGQSSPAPESASPSPSPDASASPAPDSSAPGGAPPAS